MPLFGNDWAAALASTPSNTTGDVSAPSLSASTARWSRTARDNVSLLDLAVCPKCRAAISRETEPWVCTGCDAQFPLDDGARVLIVDYDDYKRAQAAFFDDGVDSEYEITRPRGTPKLHEWLLIEKFRRSIASVSKELNGARVLSVCGGSGLDAELLTA